MTGEQPLPTPPEALMGRLSAMGIAFELHHHRPVFTADEAGFLKKTIQAVHVKNLFLKDKKDRMALITLPDEIGLDLKTLAPAIGLDRISFGSAERLWQYLGVRPGSVCPFSAINDHENRVSVILDERAAGAATVCAHPMLNSMSVTLSGHDLVKFLTANGHAPKIMNLAQYAKTAEGA